MKNTKTAQSLSKKFALADKFRDRRKSPTLPICGNLKLSPDGIEATNLDKFCYIPASVPVSRPVCLPPWKWLKGEELEFIDVLDNFACLVKTNLRSFRVAGYDPDDFPRLQTEDRPELSFALSASDLAKIQDCARLVLHDTISPISHIFFGETESRLENWKGHPSGHYIAGTDACKLKAYKVDNSPNCLIPAEAVPFLSEGAKIGFNGSQFGIQSRESTFYFRIKNARYPAFLNVIPDSSTFKVAIHADADDLRDSLNAVLPSANKVTKYVRLTVQAGESTRAKFHAEDLDMESECTDLFDCTAKSVLENPLEIGFNAEYLLDCLKGLSGPVTIKMTDPNRAALIEAEGFEICLCMPVMITTYNS